MELMAALVVLLATMALAVLAARFLLELVFQLMVHRALPVTIYWRPVLFTSALFWFWYLTPAFVESRAAARILVLLTQ